MTHRNALRLLGLAAFAAAFAAPALHAQDGTAQKDGAPPASAQPAQPAQQEKKTWAELDTDRNGHLSREESAAAPALEAVFERADANADGALTGEEYKAYLAANAQDGQPTQKPPSER
jgi:hypothetical protein